MITIANYSVFTHAGPRPNQEDYIASPNGLGDRIFVLCDGMGGHGHGDVASKTVAESVYSYLKELNLEEYTSENLQDAVDYAVEVLAKEDTFNDEKPMGTTLVVVAINRMSILVGHIGDSRCYQFDKDSNLKFRTKDHSKVQEAIDAEILTEEEAWNHPKKNILTRCIMSGKSDVRLDVDTIVVENGDMLLLCSDGVTDAMKDKQIQAVLVERSLDEISEIIESECSLKSRDNYSAILLSLNQDEANPPIVEEIAETVVPPIEESENVDKIFCTNCGGEVSLTSQFCPHCGKSIKMGTLPPPVQTVEDTLLNRLKSIDWQQLLRKYTPVIYIIGGFSIGLLVAWGCGMFSSGGDSDSKVIRLKSDSASTRQFSDFINNACAINGTSSTDSIIHKDSLESQYQDFLQKLCNNAGKQ